MTITGRTGSWRLVVGGQGSPPGAAAERSDLAARPPCRGAETSNFGLWRSRALRDPILGHHGLEDGPREPSTAHLTHKLLASELGLLHGVVRTPRRPRASPAEQRGPQLVVVDEPSFARGHRRMLIVARRRVEGAVVPNRLPPPHNLVVHLPVVGVPLLPEEVIQILLVRLSVHGDLGRCATQWCSRDGFSLSSVWNSFAGSRP